MFPGLPTSPPAIVHGALPQNLCIILSPIAKLGVWELFAVVDMLCPQIPHCTLGYSDFNTSMFLELREVQNKIRPLSLSEFEKLINKVAMQHKVNSFPLWLSRF